MYYRRKLMLALLEAFGGCLKRTDCEKLLFEFCQVTGRNHYDFFPYQYGPFSFVSYYDKRRLTELGLLEGTDDFQLRTADSYLAELDPSDRIALLDLKLKSPLGRNLVRKTYREHPEFASRSKIVSDLFEAEELEELCVAWNRDTTPLVFTVGYEGLTIDSFLNKLISNNIMAIVDVRSNPQSMKYGFSKRTFGDYVEKAGMIYTHLPELGIPSAVRKGLGTKFSHEELFNKYQTELLPVHVGAKKQLLSLIAAFSRIALVCFECDHRLCHRHFLVEYLREEHALQRPVIHL